MLFRDSYPHEYVEACRARIERQVSLYASVARAAGAGQPDAADFEAEFFNNQVIVLDACFTHRGRGIEGKDGNPLNEVRVLVGSLLGNDGRLLRDASIRLKADTSVLGLATGDRIRLDAAAFRALSTAFFAELSRRYVADQLVDR